MVIERSHAAALITLRIVSNPLVLSGMHRSATSLVASLLLDAGLAIGRELHPAGLGNPRGHFEDHEFFTLHEDMLAARGETCFSANLDFVPPADAEFLARAQRLIEERNDLPSWGWKDPRTCLFLDFWQPLLPEARYLFVYRHPVDVVLSLWRRNTDLELRQDPWLAVRSWVVHNTRVLDFCRRFPERTYLAQVPTLVAADAGVPFGALLRGLRDKLGVEIAERPAAERFVSEELISLTPPSSTWAGVLPEALDLYRRLEAHADLSQAASEAPVACIESREGALLRASETLLQALLEQSGTGGAPPTAAMRLDYYDRRALEETIAALEAARAADWEWIQQLDARAEAAEKALHGIERSWSFAPVRAWWWLRRRFGS